MFLSRKPFMRSLLRPAAVMIVLGLLAVAAGIWIFQAALRPIEPTALPVKAGDQEVAWLYHATATAVWQRFVQAAAEVTEVPVNADRAFPRLTTAVPEIALKLPKGGHLRIRWYKLTSQWTTEYWTKQLLHRKPPPLAIIGGSNTSIAIEQAEKLRNATESLDMAHHPLLLLTQATADHVHLDPLPPGFENHFDGIPLVKIYDQRTIRFCFTNRQMAQTVTSYIWSR